MGATVISLSDSASTLYADGQFESARTLFESLAEKGTADPALYYNIGNCYTRLGQFGEARHGTNAHYCSIPVMKRHFTI